MNTQQAISKRIYERCKERGLTPNGLSNIAAVPQSTRKMFFDTPYFDALGQEIV